MSSSLQNRVVGEWTLEEVIGRGAQATVYKGYDKEKKRTAAIKEFSMDNYDKASMERVYTEVSLIKSCSHPFVISLIDSFSYENNFYVVYQYIARGSLYKAIKNSVFTNDVARRIIREVLMGLCHIHTKGVIHRDIKADNILIDENNNIKIADFGISLINDHTPDDYSSNLGSSYWMAPERIELKALTPKSDIWSVGCLTLELLTGKPPYWKLTPMSALFHIPADETVPYEDVNHNITDDCRDFISECFVKDPEQRKSARELLSHPWFNTHRHNSVTKASSKPPPVTKPSFNPLEKLDINDMMDDLVSTVSNYSQNGHEKGLKEDPLLESILLSKLHILAESKSHSTAVLQKELESIMSSIEDHPETCGILILNNAPYLLITLINTNLKETTLCYSALRIIYEMMIEDPQIQTSLLLMGLTTIITRFVSFFFESSSAQLNKQQPAQSTRSESENQLMSLTVSILKRLFENEGPILDILFSSGLVNSAIQLLDSNNIEFVYSGICCLMNVTQNLTTIPSTIIHEIFFSTGIIKFLFSGLIFSNTLSSTFSFHTAIRLLDMLILYTQYENDSFVNAMITNNGLNTVVYALRLSENDIKPSECAPSLSPSTTLIEYKHRVLQLVYHLQNCHPGLFDNNLIPILLPLLQSNQSELVSLDVNLLISLLQHDQSSRILVTAVNNQILTILYNLITVLQGSILVDTLRLLLLIGKACTVPSAIQKSLYNHFKATKCFELLMDYICNESVSHDIFSFLNECRIYDHAYFVDFCRNSIIANKLASCYIQSSHSNRDEVVQAFISFVQSVPEVLIDLGNNATVMEKILYNMTKGNEINQISAIQLLSSILMFIPDKKAFVDSYNIPSLVNTVRTTKANKPYLNTLKAEL